MRRRGTAIFLGLMMLSGSLPAASDLGDLMRQGQGHWAFQPVARPDLPTPAQPGWCRNPIDRFILAACDRQAIQPAPRADRATLIRRVTLDLIGLPPTWDEVQAFVQDPDPAAYDRLVERLLASPHYGERWGRHWLDVARFAETDGFEHDAVRHNAWRYRDYVVRAFNRDQSYQTFILEQVAGDTLFPHDRHAQMATAFNLLGPDMVDSSDQIQRRLNRLNDMTDTTSLAFLGLTVGCARCHDHMFEPFSQKDYFRLQAFFTPAEFRNDHPVPTPEQRRAHEQARQRQADEMKQLQAQLKSLPKDKSKERDRLQKAIKKLEKAPPLPGTLALRPGDPDKPTHVLFRGDYRHPRDKVTAGIPAIFPSEKPATWETGQRPRPGLARWIAHADNPLTARVMVNRIWQHHFGRGLVATPSDFGLRGQAPTHPALLDWLAAEFVDRGWSIKALHRLILQSATYQVSSSASADTLARDPDNQGYAYWKRHRLEGEVIRDSLLAISGRLNREMTGPSVFPPIPSDLFKGARGWKTSPHEEDHHRRSVYIFARRNLRFPFLEVFDAPDSNLSCAMRDRSTTAPQSLTLLNSDEVRQASEALAQDIQSGEHSTRDQVTEAYRRILNRAPNEKELELALAFIQEDLSPLHELCRALFNLNAFVYVD